MYSPWGIRDYEAELHHYNSQSATQCSGEISPSAMSSTIVLTGTACSPASTRRWFIHLHANDGVNRRDPTRLSESQALSTVSCETDPRPTSRSSLVQKDHVGSSRTVAA